MSTSAASRGLHRAWLLIPLLVSLGSVLAQLWLGNPCGGSATCEVGWQALSWTAVVFPHALAFPLLVSPLGLAGTGTLLVIVDAVLVAVMRRVAPAILDTRQATALVFAWILLSVVTVWATPGLMTFARSLGPG